jgi:hypothetical protein
VIEQYQAAQQQLGGSVIYQGESVQGPSGMSDGAAAGSRLLAMLQQGRPAQHAQNNGVAREGTQMDKRPLYVANGISNGVERKDYAEYKVFASMSCRHV